MRVPSLVRAASGAAWLLLGCRVPQGPGVTSLGVAALPPPVDGRETRASYRLPNGLAVVLEENHVTPVVAAQVWVRAGAADEPASARGAAAIVERALVDGARRIDAGGAHLVGWCSPDAAVFEAAVAAPFAGSALDALGAIISGGALEPAVFARARAAVLEERRAADGDGAARASRALLGGSFGGHGYGHGVLADDVALGALTLESAEAFRREAYAAPNVTLVVTGDFDARVVRARIAAAFGAAPGAPGTPAARAPLPALAGPRAVVEGQSAAQGGAGVGRVALGFRFAALADADVEAADLVAAVLGGGADGLLPRAVVRNGQLASSVETSVFVGRDAGLLVVDAVATTGGVDELTRALLTAATRLTRDELAPAEIDRARRRLEASLAQREETAASRAARLGFFAAVGDDAALADRYGDRLRSLGPRQVRAAAAALLSPKALTIAAVLPAASAQARAPKATETRLAALAGVAVATAAAEPPVAGAGATVSSENGIVRVLLPSGPRVLVLRDRAAPSVALVALWSGGARLEDARTNGSAALLAALLPAGTRTRDATRVAADAAELGGTLTAFAGRDELGLRLETVAAGWERGLELLADCALHPAFAEAEVERARRALIDRVRADEDDASFVVTRVFTETLFPRHPYRLPLRGTADSISALTRGRLAEHFRRLYGGANLTLAIVGDVDVERAVGRTRALFANAPAGSPAPAAPSATLEATEAPTEVFRVAAKDDARIVVGFAGVPLRDADRGAVGLLARVLGAAGGPLARAAGSSAAGVTAWSGVDGGALAIALDGAPGALDAAVPAVRAALTALVETGVAAPQIERARDEAVAAQARALEHRADAALALARDEAFGLPLGTTRGQAAALAAVTPETLARVARRILDPRREIVVAVRPPAPAAVAKATPKPAVKVPATTIPSGGGRAPAP